MAVEMDRRRILGFLAMGGSCSALRFDPLPWAWFFCCCCCCCWGAGFDPLILAFPAGLSGALSGALVGVLTVLGGDGFTSFAFAPG